MKKIFIFLPLVLSSLSFSSPNIENTNSIDSIDDLRCSEDEINKYYYMLRSYSSDLEGELFLSALQNVLSYNQEMVNYDGKVKGVGSSKKWDNYLLLDRDWTSSPLTDSEISKLESGEKLWWQNDNVYVNLLYNEDPFLFDRSVVNQTGSSANQIDREHVYPKSYGFNYSDDDDGYEKLLAGVDMHNLHASEGNANSVHKNYPYGEVGQVTQSATSSITGKINGSVGESTSSTYSEKVFEPGDKDKGDIARSAFYMAARYHRYEEKDEDGYPTPTLTLSNTPTEPSGTYNPLESSQNDISYGILSELIAWDELDPVSEEEKIRNDLNYKYIQKNRNPFVDYPLWVDLAFNPDTNYVLDLDSPTGVRTKTQLELASGEIADKYDINSTLDLSNLEFRLSTGATISKDLIDINLKNRFTSAGQGYSTYVNSITLDTEGYFEITFSYASYELKKQFVVGNPKLTFTADFSSLKDEYNIWDSLDFGDISAKFILNQDELAIENSKLSIKLSSNGIDYEIDQSETYSLSTGSYTLEVSTEGIDGQTYIQTFNFEVSIPQYVIIVGAIILTIALIAVLILMFKSKKNKKTTKTKKSSKSKKKTKSKK